jgi:spore maturation protein CgeB
LSRPLAGFSVVLVARFNRRYHQVGPALEAAFRSLGAAVIPVEVKTRGLGRLAGRTLGRRLGAALRQRPDLVLSFKAGELDPALIGELRGGSAARWANWFPDGPQELELSLRIGAGYDRTFLFDSSMVDRHRALGRPAEYLGLGFDPALFRPIPEPGPPIPLVFVGSPDPDRDLALGSVADLGLACFGPGRPEGPVFGDRLVRLLSRAAVALNVHVWFGSDPTTGRYGTGANQRVYEIAGVGRCQLCDAKADLLRAFEEDREIVLYRTVPELREKAMALLADPARAAELGERGRRRALAEHTWAHRVRELVDRMFP